MTPETAAAILNVSSDASEDEIRRAYKNRSKMWHPDRFVAGTAGEQADAAAEFVRISDAYQTLLTRSEFEAAPQATESTRAATAPDTGVRAYFGLGPRPERSAARRFGEYLGFGIDQTPDRDS